MKKLLVTLAVIVMSVTLVAVAAIGYNSIRSNRKEAEEARERLVEVQKAAEEARIASEYKEDLMGYLEGKTVVEDYITDRDGEEVRVITYRINEEGFGDDLRAMLVNNETNRVFAIGSANDLLN